MSIHFDLLFHRLNLSHQGDDPVEVTIHVLLPLTFTWNLEKFELLFLCESYFVGKFKKGDIVVESSGAQVVVDSKSALYLRGTTLNFSDALMGGGFKFENPNATSSCSCGESFSV